MDRGPLGLRAAGPLGRRGPWAAGLLLAKPLVFRRDVEFCVKNHEKRPKILWVRFKGSFTLQKKLGPDPSKKWYGPITLVKKYWSFHRAIGAPYHFFDGTGPNFFCCVNEPLVYSWLIEAQGISA